MAVTYNGSWTGRGDQDTFTFDLIGGQSYTIALTGATGYVYRLDAGAVNPDADSPDPGPTSLAGHAYNVLARDENYDELLLEGGEPGHFTPLTTGTYSFRAVGVASAGSYVVTLDAIADDYADNINSTGQIVDGVGRGTFDAASDADFFATDMIAGKTYFFGEIGETDEDDTIDPDFLVVDAAGNVTIAEYDYFTAPTSGRYYVVATAYSNNDDPGDFNVPYSFFVNDVYNGARPKYDFDDDGTSDVLWRKTDGTVTYWSGGGGSDDGGGGFNARGAADVVSRDWTVAGAGDFDGDFISELLWLHADGRLTTWSVNNEDEPYFVAGASVYDPGAGWSVAGLNDFTGDNRDDIVMRHIDGRVAIWAATPTGFAAGQAEAVDVAWKVAGTGDFNDDGRADILWRNDNGAVTAWYAREGGFDKAVFALPVAASWSVAGTGDFNADGHDDVLWRNADGTLTNWFGTDTGFTAGTFAAKVGTEWTVEATGDYNGDGRADILWRNANGQIAEWDATDTGFVQSANVGGVVGTDWSIVL